MLSGRPLTITDAWLTKTGNYEAGRINSGAACVGSLCQSLPNYIGEHALNVSRSSAITALVNAPSVANFPKISQSSGTDPNNQSLTVAAAAWGYGSKRDNE